MKKIQIRKRWLKFFAFGFLAIAAISGISTFFVFKFQTNNSETVIQPSSYSVSIEGAVEQPGDYTFEQPMTIRQIIFQAQVKTNADTSSLDLEKIINKDTNILVPFKIGTINKIKWKDLTNVEQLTQYGVKKSIAIKIIQFRQQNETTTWEQIRAIKGIGEVTINQLKEIIDLS